MLILLENSTQDISNSEDFHYLHWRLEADYPGHVTTYFRIQCQRPVYQKDPICDIPHSIEIKYKYLYTKPQSTTPFISNSHTSHFCSQTVEQNIRHNVFHLVGFETPSTTRVWAKGRDLTQSYDKSPYTHRKTKKATWQQWPKTQRDNTQNATKNFNYTCTTFANRLRTVSWDPNLPTNHKSCVIKRTHI